MKRKTRSSNRQGIGANGNGLGVANETSETEKEDDALQETEIKLLNDAGFSTEALNAISYKEKIEILKAITESHTESVEDSTQNESTAKRDESQSFEPSADSSNFNNETPEEGETKSNIDSPKPGCSSEGSVNISSTKEDVSSNNSLITMSPLFKSKVQSARPINTEVGCETMVKPKSLWSHLNCSSHQMNPDQYTEVIKLIYDLYFRRVRREQMAMKGPVQKWGKPVLPGPHVEGCLLSEKAKRCMEKRLSNTMGNRLNGDNDVSKRDNNALTLGKEDDDDSSENVRDDECKIMKVYKKDAGDGGDDSDDEFEINPCNMKYQRKILSTEKKSQTDESKSKVLKDKNTILKTTSVNSRKRLHVIEEDIYSIDADDPFDTSTRSIKKSRLKHDHKKGNTSPLFVWSSNESSDSDVVCKEDQDSVLKSVNNPADDEDFKMNDSSIPIKQPDDIDDLDETQVPESPKAIDLEDARVETSLESADNKLSQESTSCYISNSQSSNSLLDPSGYIYSTQITARKRKLRLKTDQTQSSSATDEHDTEGKLDSKKRRVGDEDVLVKTLDKTVVKKTALAAPEDDLNLQDDTESYVVDCTVNFKDMTLASAETYSENELAYNTALLKLESKQAEKIRPLKKQKANTSKQQDGQGDGIDVLEKVGCTSQAAEEEGDPKVEEKMQCPICGDNFNQNDIEEHASLCGEGVHFATPKWIQRIFASMKKLVH